MYNSQDLLDTAMYYKSIQNVEIASVDAHEAYLLNISRLFIDCQHTYWDLQEAHSWDYADLCYPD